MSEGKRSGFMGGLGIKGLLVIVVAIAIVGLLVAVLWRREAVDPARVAGAGAPREIVARARIEPLGRVLVINGPAPSTLIKELRVDQGSKLTAGQVLAVLDGYDVHRADLAVAEGSLKLAELQLAQVKAGAKSADIAAQTAVVAAKKVQLALLQKQWERRSAADLSKVVSRESLDSLRADLDQGKNGVEQAENTLKSLTEVRAVDQAVAAARVEVEKASVERARADMERLLVRAPGPGTVLSIESRAGEAISPDGILRMADLSHVIVIAEIDETEAASIKEGMPAQIEGSIIGSPVKAAVTRVAYEVFRQKRPASDVLIGRDARIVEVEVTPQSPIPTVIGGEVTVRLTPPAPEKR